MFLEGGNVYDRIEASANRVRASSCHADRGGLQNLTKILLIVF